MTIQVALNHKTKYSYDKFVALGPQIIRLYPASHSRTKVISYSLNIEPKKHFINWQQDPYGNHLARIVFPEKVDSFTVEVDLVADMTVINPFDFFLEKTAEDFPFKYEPNLEKELFPFLSSQKPGPLLKNFIASLDLKPQRTIDFLMYLNKMVHSKVKYLIRLEPGVQTSEETLKLGSGSCRDSALLMVEVLRQIGLAARFTSGYSIILKPDKKVHKEDPDIEKDFIDLHAWAEVYLPGAGWVGIDPSSGLLVGEGAIPLVSTPDPSSAAPITGELELCTVDFSHSMSVTRIKESPRTTKPYSEEQFKEINQLGKLVDKQLKKADVRLTTGGEPTFISSSDMEAPEWNTQALGPTKKKLSFDLLKKLKKEWTNGALLHHGQGKWYPGEPLPRWSLGCFWRQDGKPIWQDETLLANEIDESNFNIQDAQKFITELAKNLKIDETCIKAVYEDSFHYLNQEQKLPSDLSVYESKLECELERKKLYEIFTSGLETIAGYTLPLQTKTINHETHWLTSDWQVRTDKIYLLPGTSPIGLRLPLNSLIYKNREIDLGNKKRDPMDEAIHQNKKPQKSITKSSITNEIIRTALCVEIRDGRLYVFMPPLELIEDYLFLIQKIEKIAAKLKIPVLIEGYEVPYNKEIKVLKITPDPGVIEVNIPPNDNWDDIVRNTKSLYTLASECGLSAEKFMLDGKHTGTGGGNHIVLGAQTPSESPFLRRPDLLASLLAYWNNHPSLSYLFSGLFVGPTSQAPRVDEGRQDSLYELEIALEQISQTDKALPWFIDRALRNLLVDLTGNTHRAEFCIDKLFSPDSSTGRLGLVELRGFEMPPDYQMNLAQQLLIHSLIARFWEKPYKEKLIHWKTSLHDRFMLPYFVKKDFEAVIRDLNNHGIKIKSEYFASHFEFRFPFYGELNYQDINLELRYAIEPWYVLGEESSAGGTARYVDSSLERLQVQVKGLMNPRYIITCNNRRIPLQTTDTEGLLIAGVRYKAWQPYSALHPSIPIHTPLTFDIVDLESKKAIAGCQYHVCHPAGRNYSTIPINEREAEARRASRFLNTGHSPGIMDTIPKEEINPNFPCTLDLRKS